MVVYIDFRCLAIMLRKIHENHRSIISGSDARIITGGDEAALLACSPRLHRNGAASPFSLGTPRLAQAQPLPASVFVNEVDSSFAECSPDRLNCSAGKMSSSSFEVDDGGKAQSCGAREFRLVYLQQRSCGATLGWRHVINNSC
jgi:hypothetical protein